MKKVYKQLTLAQRYEIESYLKVGKNKTEIALLIGVNKSTISRELNRNVPKRGFGAKVYHAEKAQLKTKKRHAEKAKCIKLTMPLKLQIKEWMARKKWSPQLIKVEWDKSNANGVSHECIYQFIWRSKHSNKRIDHPFKYLYNDLKHGNRRRKRGNYKDSRGLIPNRVSIEKRPKVVEKRKRLGDFEVDLIMGKDHQSALLITLERSTLVTTIDKLEGKNAAIITNKIISRLKYKTAVKTITFDNDLAFSKHLKIAESLDAKTYFTRPYTSQNKGSIENRNGVIRQFFPKKTDFTLIDKKEIRRVEKEINNRPVRKFGYLTPNELYLQKKVSVALIS